MPQQASQSVENNFTAGLKTEFTGLNFPDNAATDTDNCVYTLIGDVERRLGFDYEDNFTSNFIANTGQALSTYKWNNVGGDGSTQILVSQVGNVLYFYRSSSATIASPLSSQLLVSTVFLNSFLPAGSSNDPSLIECQFSDGNGYLFVYHPQVEPFYVSYTAGTLTAAVITLKIRDFAGLKDETSGDTDRPALLSDEHKYNLINQGWTASGTWSVRSNPFQSATLGSHAFTIFSSVNPAAITVGQSVKITGSIAAVGGLGNWTAFLGIVTAVSASTITINANKATPVPANFVYNGSYTIVPVNTGYIDTWFTTTGFYPANADVWWTFKDSTDSFSPTSLRTTYSNVTLSAGPAPKGSFILDAFNQQRDSASGISTITDVVTPIRPRTGTWFQGRVWYAGVDGSQATTGDAQQYNWSENIYFSQTVVTADQFGRCYQTNDPTSETLFNLLPTDGGVIQIQGCGAVYKLFPIQNGMIVFAANGIWFITGSQGIGFTADDYTITKISQIQSISSTSFVNVQGLPYFWNEEGIYTVMPAQQGLGLSVNPLTVDSILSFYMDIPLSSKKYVRGDYDPVNYVLTYIYRSEEETDITSRYSFDRTLNFNTYNKAFYPYTIEGSPVLKGINYVTNTGGATAPTPGFKYLTATSSTHMTFSEEKDEDYLDFTSAGGGGTDFTSYFVTGYKLRGQATRRFQPQYIYMYSRNDEPTAYKIQGIWDFANSRDSGRWSSIQVIQNNNQYSGMLVKRHRIRGQGLALQLKISSVSGSPFDVMGWAITESSNAGA